MKPTAKGVMKKNILLLVCVNYREYSLEYSLLVLSFIFYIMGAGV